MTTNVFLQQFFGNTNKVKYEDVVTHRGLAFLRNSISRLDSDPKGFVILPFVFDDKKRTLWCGIAFSEEQSGEMRRLLNYFVGTSFTNLNSQSTINPQTPVGKVIEQYTELKYCTKFLGDYGEIKSALERMYALLSKRPYRQVKRSNSIGSLLRSYSYALTQMDEPEAHRLIGELRSRKILDAESQTFLNIEVAAHFSKWGTIYNHPQLRYILSARRPTKITSYLLQAAFETEVAPLLREGNIERAMTYFSTELLPQILPLYLDGLVDTNERVLKMWMLKVASDKQADSVLYHFLTEEAKKVGLEDQEWQALVAWRAAEFSLPTYDSQTAQELMIQAMREGDLLRAKELGKCAPDSLAKAQMLMQCAVQHRDLEAFNNYWVVKQALTEKEAGFLDQTIKQSFGGDLQSEVWMDSESVLPTTWPALIERINEDEDFARNKAAAIISNSSFSKLAGNGEEDQLDWEKLNVALGGYRSPLSHAVLMDLLPHLITFLKDDKSEEKFKVSVFNTLLDLLLTTDELRKSDLQMLNDLVDYVLRFGVPKERYTAILMMINGLKKYYDTVYTVDCLMDFVEVVIQYRVQDNGDLLVVLDTLKRIIAHQHKIKSQDDVKRLFNSICAYLELNEFSFEIDAPQATEEANPWQFYKGKRIGIYTLTESAAQRAQEFLRELNLGIVTTINNDHVGKDALKELATRSNFLVIVSSSAKHAATDYIKQHRSDQPLLYASGKGSSSILSALREYAKAES